MARVTYVKKAQQRYRMVPVIDPETGQQATRIMQRKRPTKSGATTSVVRITKEDRDQPLPPYNCTYCHKPIEVGTPYKWIQPKSGPYGGTRLNRHAGCPTWNVWDYSSSLSARLAQIAHDFWNAFEDCTTKEDVEAALEETASEIESLAEEKRESASSIEDGFGHPTYVSEELEETATSLDDWAEEVRTADVPEPPEPEEGDCEDCDGTGEGLSNGEDGTPEECANCDGTGTVTPDEPTDEQMDEWREEARDAASVVDESPV